MTVHQRCVAQFCRSLDQVRRATRAAGRRQRSASALTARPARVGPTKSGAMIN